MSLNQKRKRRLLAFLAAFVAIIVLGAGAYLYRDRQLERRAIDGRERGFQLLEQQDYYGALHAIGPYARRHPEDAQTLFSYALARENVPEPNDRHLSDAMGLYRRVLSLSPAHVEASERLLTLYGRAGFTAEALDLSDRLLDLDPANRVALRTRVEVLLTQRSFDEALASALRLAELTPQDLLSQIMVLEVLRQQPSGRQKLLDRAQQLRDQHPDDVRFEILQGVAFELAGRRQEAADLVRLAATKPMPDAQARRMLFDGCDRLGLHAESLRLLELADAEGHSDPETSLALGRRLYQVGRFEEVLALEDESTSLAVIRCLSLLELGRTTEASEVAEGLAPAEGDPSAAWKPVLVILCCPGADAVDLAQACRAAIERQPSDPLLQMVAAEAFANVGEASGSFLATRRAAELAPAWARPLTRLAQAAAVAGRWSTAAELAQGAIQRSDGEAEALRILALSLVNLARTEDQASLERASAAVDRWAQAEPDDGRIAALRVHLLGTRGSLEEAKAAALDMIHDPDVPARVLASLADLSRQFGLGIEEEVIAACEKSHGPLPWLVFLKARRLYEAGETDQAIELVDSASRRAGELADRTGSRSDDYVTLHARFLEAIGDPGAGSAWARLADAHPGNVNLTWQAVNSSAAQADHAFIGRALARLKDRIGEGGLSWRTARARWLLSSPPDGTTDKAVEAALILNEITHEAPSLLGARQLLAEALTRLGNHQGAVEQLTIAANLDPASAQVSLELATALQARGQLVQAQPYLRRVLQGPTATPAQKLAAAELGVAVGDFDIVIVTLETLQVREINERGLRLLLWLYERTGQSAKAEALCQRLMDDSKGEWAGVVAPYYLSRSQPEKAAQAIAQLDQADLPPSQASLVRGDVALAGGDVEQALSHYRSAVASAPGEARPRRSLLRTLALHGRLDEFAAEANSAGADVPAERAFTQVAAVAERASALQERWPEVAGMLSWLLDHPEDVADIEKALQRLERQEPTTVAAVLDQFLALADSSQRVLPLQMLAARVHLENGQPAIAAQLTSRSMRAFVTDADIARLAALALHAAGRSAEAVVAADEWRARAPNQALAADLVAASALGQQGDFQAAADRLARHNPAGVPDPEVRRGLILQRASLAGRLQEFDVAAELLRPLLAGDSGARSAWIGLAAAAQDPEVAAAWFTEVAPLAAEDGIGRRLSLIDACFTAARRLDSAALGETAQQLLSGVNAEAEAGTLLKGDALEADHWLALGMLNEKCGDAAAAERAYRRSLELEARNAVAANNLAMMLRKSAPDEALRLAQIAAEDKGANRASFLDTLSAVHESRGEVASALAVAGEAAELAPSSAAIQLRFARLLAESGQQPRADEVLDEVEKLTPASSLGAFREEIEKLRARQR